MNLEHLDKLADDLWEAQQARVPIAPLTAALPDLTPNDAYDVARRNIARRMSVAGPAGKGPARVGYKVGLTSRAMQQWLGIDQPDYGTLLSDMIVADGATADLRSLLQPRIEAEVAFVLGQDLDQAFVSAAEVLRATDFVLPALEIVDSRIEGWKFKVCDTIADNASSGLFVLGSRRTALDGLDLRLCGMALRKNGEVAVTGAGAACLGNPVSAVAWLANALHSLGEPLRAGHIVLSGALGPVVEVAAGDVFEAEIAQLGKVGVRF
ncbi:MAG: fumarylacetoacetate hydrolase family protein [Cyanobacteria bacterium REEB65]|nr:fumarylacetoacetate hydrolase family protein [Cyanobacteria bacterium REEB65]